MLPGSVTALDLPASDETSGLIGWWTFDDATAEDVSGSNNYGTLNGGTLPWAVDGMVPPRDDGPSTGLGFNGSTSYVDVPNFSFSGPSLSVTFWLQAGIQVNNARPIANSHTDSDNNGFQLILGGTNLTFHVGNGTTNIGLNATDSALTDGNWHLVVCTYQASGNQIIYFDGVSVASQASLTGNVTAGSTTLGFGRNNAYAGDYYTGNLDDIRIYNRVIGADEVWALYAAGIVSPQEGEWPALFVAGGGNVFSVSVTETASATESDSVVATFAASDTEAASATDTDGGGYTVAQTEAGTATDTESATAVFAASTSEAGTATDSDSAAAVFAASDTEAASASDTDSGAAVFAASDTEAASVVDSSSATTGAQTFNDSVTEAASASDSSDATLVAGFRYGRNHKGGGGKYSGWRPLKKKRRTEEEELEELLNFLKAVGEAKAADILAPPVAYHGPLSAAFYTPTQPRYVPPKRTANAVNAIMARAKAEAKRRQDDDDEAAAILLLM